MRNFTGLQGRVLHTAALCVSTLIVTLLGIAWAEAGCTEICVIGTDGSLTCYELCSPVARAPLKSEVYKLMPPAARRLPVVSLLGRPATHVKLSPHEIGHGAKAGAGPSSVEHPTPRSGEETSGAPAGPSGGGRK